MSNVYQPLDEVSIVEYPETKIAIDLDGNEIAVFGSHVDNDTIIHAIRIMNRAYEIGYRCGKDAKRNEILRALDLSWLIGHSKEDEGI